MCGPYSQSFMKEVYYINLNGFPEYKMSFCEVYTLGALWTKTVAYLGMVLRVLEHPP